MSSQIGTIRDSEETTLAGAEVEVELREPLERAELRIHDLETRLAGQARARAELVHLVSHELRTPITVITGFTRLLQNPHHGVLTAEQQRFTSEILKACGRLDQFVVDLLEARPDEESPFMIHAQEADLHDSLSCQLESLSPLLEERGIKLEARFCADTARLAFDERRVEQVITNLMTNAIRHCRASGVIRIATESVFGSEAGRSGDCVEVSIEDDGPGIPEADRERLFAPYVRGEESCALEQSNAGLGIGLAISRRIIGAHGGRIWVEAGELGGARFVFSLPRTRCAGGEG